MCLSWPRIQVPVPKTMFSESGMEYMLGEAFIFGALDPRDLLCCLQDQESLPIFAPRRAPGLPFMWDPRVRAPGPQPWGSSASSARSGLSEAMQAAWQRSAPSPFSLLRVSGVRLRQRGQCKWNRGQPGRQAETEMEIKEGQLRDSRGRIQLGEPQKVPGLE